VTDPARAKDSRHPCLRVDECELPESGWGMLRLTGSAQHAGRDWGDDPSRYWKIVN
jgi:hypothetical protein